MRVVSGVVFALIMGVPAFAQAYTWDHYAGTQGGAGSLDLLGNSARFQAPAGIVCDSAGNIYVAAGGNNGIRIISPAGQVSTLAGSFSNSGFTEGRRHQVVFSNIRQIAMGSDGSLYAAASSGPTIMKITRQGAVTIYAGTTGAYGSENGTLTTATFTQPYGVAFDSSGNLYVADRGAHTIRKITPQGVVSTFAGIAGTSGSDNGPAATATFNGPEAVATDSAGNVYVADTANHMIRKITTGGTVSTFAGQAGSPGLVNDNGTSAMFRSPGGITVDGSGNVYVADTGNHVIRKITSTGDVTTRAGSGAIGQTDDNYLVASFWSPTAVALDSSGNLYVADRENFSIRKISTGNVVSTIAGQGATRGAADAIVLSSARFAGPWGVAVDGSEDVFVSDSLNQKIRRIDVSSGAVSTFAGSGSAGYSDGTGTGAQFRYPAGLSFAPSGNLYVADYGAHTLRRITPEGVVTTHAGSGGNSGTANGTGSVARFNSPRDTVVEGSYIYVADSGNHAIRRVNGGGAVESFAGLAGTPGAIDATGTNARFNRPTGIVSDATYLYVADMDNHAIRRIVISTGEVTTFAGTLGAVGFADGNGAAARFYSPESIAIDSAGNLYVGEYNSKRIRKITPARDVTTIGGQVVTTGSEEGTALVARFGDPAALDVDSFGTIYVADYTFNMIRRGTEALDAAAAIDSATGSLGAARQLSTSPNPGSSWQWDLIRKPAGSTAALSSATIASPTFTPDVPDSYVFRLSTSNGSAESITLVELTVPCAAIALAPVLPAQPVIGSAYSQAITPTGGTAPYTMEITSGSLPPGLTLSGTTISGTATVAGEYTFTLKATDNLACSGERTYTLTAATLARPTGLVATFAGPGSVSLTWNAVSGASGYRVYRRYGYGAWSELTTRASASYTDTDITNGYLYAYAVTAYDGASVETAMSRTDIALSFNFPTLVPGSSIVQSVHIIELRVLISQARWFGGFTGSYAYTDNDSLSGVTIKAAHITEMRAALNEAFYELGLSPISFTNPSVTGLAVKALHVTELRSALQ